MTSPDARQLIGVALLIALLAAAVLLPRLTDDEPAGETLLPEEALARYGFYMTEVSEQAGVDFVHQAPEFDADLSHVMPQVAAMGASVSVADYDGDGWNDFYVTNSAIDSANRLYRNLGDGTFQDVAAELGVAHVNQAGTGVSMGAVWGDYDNDGFEDLFIYKYGRPMLLHNDAGAGFTEVDTSGALPDWANLGSAIWFDYDRDGWLDLFAGGYFHEDLDLWNLDSTRMMPDSFEYAENGGRNYLLRNLGGVAFEEVAEETGVNSRRWVLAAAAADIRGSGYPDLVVANDYGVSQYFLNEEGRQFREVGKETGIGGQPKSGMNVAFGDVFNDGRLAVYETNITEEGVLLQGNNLFVPRDGENPNAVPRFDNLAAQMGVELGGWSFGAQFGDLNNDGNVDLFLTNGYVSGEPGSDYWYDFAKVAGGHSSIISDAKNWPAMNGRSLSGFQRKRVWLNDGAGRFSDVAPLVGVNETYDGRAVALADFWNRGVLDAVVAHQRGPVLLYRNNVGTADDGANGDAMAGDAGQASNAATGQNWIQFAFEPTASNRSAIGTQVRLHWDGKEQVQVLGGGNGFSSQNHRRLHFGLGTGTQVDRVEIQWPSGAVQTVEAPTVNQLHTISEEGGAE